MKTRFSIRPRFVDHTLSTLLLRLFLFALLWWILTDGAMDSWLVGVPVVVFATLASLTLLPRVYWSWIGLLRFGAFFLWRSLNGGVDVARRALHPRLPISPGLYDHRWRLPTGPSRVFMANVVSLLPGTLSADLDEEYLRVHVLDASGHVAKELAFLEQQVGALFGVKFSADVSKGVR